MSYVVLALKWRPQTFDQVTGQDAIAQTLKNAIRLGRTAHAYLFTGPRGVGKTSTARILAKALNCAEGPTPEPCNRCDACREITTGRSLDVIEIDGASNRGIDDIRELRESVRYAPASGRTKIYIIDEVHMLTTDAFNALLKTLEEPPPHVVFVLATTEPLKVPATILSRCQRYDFSRLRVRDTVGRLKEICTSEGIEATDDGLSLIARRAEGSMRDALTLLDQVVASGRTPLDADTVTSCLGIAGRDLYFAISEAILDADPRRALELLGNAYVEGQNLQEMAEELVQHLRNLLVLSVGEGLEDLVEATDVERARYQAQAGRSRPADLIRQLQIAVDTATKMRRSAFPRVLLELAVAEICLLPRAIDLAEALRGLPAGEPPATRSSAAPSAPAAPPARTIRSASSAKSPTAPRSQADLPATGIAIADAPAPLIDPELTCDPGDVAADIDAPAELEAEPGTPWDDVVRRVRQAKPGLGAALRGTAIAAEDNGYLKIRFPAGCAAFHKKAVLSSENRTVLMEAVQAVYGRPLGWKVDGPVDEEKAPAREEAGTRARGRSNLADIERIAKRMNGEILGPA